ncbi:MAG TPA: hypothetical protein VIK53_10705 [Verrucomicrobiae bacterium]
MSSSKHVPFDSIYRPGFEVVEERQGKVSLYPHTEQLPLLLRAINLEFQGGLPDRIARVDKRADGLSKIIRRHAALMYCSTLNRARSDHLHLFQLADNDLVARVTIVQQISESTPLGRIHRFRFYGGENFFPEIYLSGKRVAFADHVLQRFSSRVPNNLGEDLTYLLLGFFGTPIVSMPVGKSHAFVIQWHESMLAFTYRETPDEFILTTCLTINEINSLERQLPAFAHNFHFGQAFTKPRLRTWFPSQWMEDIYSRWRRKISLPPAFVHDLQGLALKKIESWHWLAQGLKDNLVKNGHGPGSQICFTDQIPGPCVLELKPGQPIPAFDEIACLKQLKPDVDWDAIMAARAANEAEARKP